MITVLTPSDVDDPQLRFLLERRFDQLAGYGCTVSELAHFVIVQPGDDIEAELGFSPLINLVDSSHYGEPAFEPSCEWIEDHGSAWELPFITSDDGYGYVIFVPKGEGIDPQLQSMCRDFATNAGGSQQQEN